MKVYACLAFLVAMSLSSSSCGPSESRHRNSAFDRFESRDGGNQNRDNVEITSDEFTATPGRGTKTAVPSAGAFSKCGSNRFNCVVDGDTLWLNGTKVRVADIDTPEISQPKCEAELALGIKATSRFIELLNEGEFDVVPAQQDEDRYGRKLRRIVRDGRSLGDQLISEGLARQWSGKKEPWC
jgi:micrococcal nuclease